MLRAKGGKYRCGAGCDCQRQGKDAWSLSCSAAGPATARARWLGLQPDLDARARIKEIAQRVADEIE